MTSAERCSFESCNKPRRCKGLCGTHYESKRRRWLKDNGRCGVHPGSKVITGNTRCERCLKNWRTYARKFRTGVSAEQYESAHREQGGVCAICKEPETSSLGVRSGGAIRSLAADHDHVTGVFRGLLCSNCNRAVGLFRDSTELLRAAIDYLEQLKLKLVS